MAILVIHRDQDAAGTNGAVHTTGAVAGSIVKYKLRTGWSATLRFMVNARDDADGTSAWFEVICAAKNVAGTVTIDGTATQRQGGVAAIAALTLAVNGTTNAGHVTLTTPGLAAHNIWWVGDVEVWGNK